jgi:Zn-dependent protease
MESSEYEILKIASMVLALMIAIIGHEIMHGVAAWRYGDSTAKDAGRFSINPIQHIDPIGTIVLPAILFLTGAPFLFGWAKPVPVHIRTVLRNGGYTGAIVVALAGVGFNFCLALFASLAIGSFIVDDLLSYFCIMLLMHLVLYNVVLGVFNLWPIPPLDGSQALGYLCAQLGLNAVPQFFNRIERYGMLILLLVLITPLKVVLFAPVQWIVNFLL